MIRRETIINILLGALLLSPIVLAFAVGCLLLRGLDFAVQHLFPNAIHHPDDTFYALMSVSLLVSLPNQLRRRSWTKLFFCFATLWTLSLAWLMHPHSFDLVTLWPLLIFWEYDSERIPRADFLKAAALMVACVALAIDLFGPGLLSSLAYITVTVVTLRWMYIRNNKVEFGSEPVLKTS